MTDTDYNKTIEEKPPLDSLIYTASKTTTGNRPNYTTDKISESNCYENQSNTSEQPSEKEISELAKDFGILSLEEQQRIKDQASKAEKPPKKERIATGRVHQIKTRLTNSELALFRDRVEFSGMKQGDFIRTCLLNEKIIVRNLTDIDEQLFKKIIEISSDLGRIGGLIRGTVIANKENFEVLTPDNKNQLEVEIRELHKVKQELLTVVQNLYGNS